MFSSCVIWRSLGCGIEYGVEGLDKKNICVVDKIRFD